MGRRARTNDITCRWCGLRGQEHFEKCKQAWETTLHRLWDHFTGFWQIAWTIILEPTFRWWCADKSPHPLHLTASCVTNFFAEHLSPDIYSSSINITFTVRVRFWISDLEMCFPNHKYFAWKMYLKNYKVSPPCVFSTFLISGAQKWKWILGHSPRYCQRKKEMKSLPIFKSS